MASNRRTSVPRPAPAAHGLDEEALLWPVPVPSQAELASAFSQVLDLAEGRSPGHAARVCYIALNLAQAAGLSPEQQRDTFYAALLHDAGAAAASAELCRLENLSEEAVFGAQPEKSPQQLALEIAPSNTTAVVEALRSHAERGARLARDLALHPGVQQAIAAHHERWDGRGYPKALKGKAIPAVARVVAAADLTEALIASEANALAARRNLLVALADHAGAALEPELVHHGRQLSRSDAFWLGLHSDGLVQELSAFCPEEPTRASPADFRTFATVFASLADAKGEHTTDHGPRTANLADRLAEELGFSEGHRELLRIAALLHDVGLLGVPARTIAKPDILSLTEMQEMRKHPTYSQLVLEPLPGLEEVARWVGAHHERPDGKGYPEMLEDETVPIEARILALADTYVALTSPRPYRRALSDEDAQQVLLGGAGTQLDRRLVQIFCSRASDLTSSRTAPRSRQRR